MTDDKAATRRISRLSAAIYLPISLSSALVFLLAAGALGDYGTVARFGGAAWVGILSLIVSMPLVTSGVKSRMTRRSS